MLEYIDKGVPIDIWLDFEDIIITRLFFRHISSEDIVFLLICTNKYYRI